MRTLPATPNLAYLKQQAKDLLEALRETRSDATLSDAQRAVAQQYGFHAWTELKREVEQLRASPEPAGQDLVTEIAARFGLGEVTAPGILVARELSCPVLRIRTTAGEWQARGLLAWMTDSQIDEGIRLMEAAAAAGMRTPIPKRSVTEALAEQIGEWRWRVDEWMDLGPDIVKPLASKTAFRLGEALGTLHALRLIPRGPMGAWTGERHSPEQWERVLAKVEELDAPWAGALGSALPTIQDLMTIATDPPGDLVLSHNDLQNAAHMSKDGSLTVVGWEFAGATPPLWELGSTLHGCTETPDGGLNTSIVPSIIDGYAAATGARPEINLSIFAMAINAWDSWVLSRMNIALSDETDESYRTVTMKEIDHILGAPLSRERLEEIVRAAS